MPDDKGRGGVRVMTGDLADLHLTVPEARRIGDAQ